MKLTIPDLITIVICLLGLIFFSYYIGKKIKNKDEFYFAGRNIHWFIIGISLTANSIDGMDISAIPGWVFTKDLKFAFGILLSPLLILIYSYFWMPIWLKLKKDTVFDYLTMRFSKYISRSAAIVFLLGGIPIAGAAIYITSLYINFTTGFNIYISILLILTIVGFYSYKGGAKVDIYTDIFQFIIFTSGILFTIYFCTQHVGGIKNAWVIADQCKSSITNDKATTLISFIPSLNKEATFWAILAFYLYYGVFAGINQNIVQRIESSGNNKAVQRKSLIVMVCANIVIIGLLGFTGVSLVAYGFYNPDFFKDLGPDYILPKFVSEIFPEIFRGLMLISLLFATMSTIDTTINVGSNILLKFKKEVNNELIMLKRAKKIVLLLIVIIGIMAILLSFGSEFSIIQKVGSIGSMLAGPLTAVFVAGLISNRVNSKSVIIGSILGIATFFLLKENYASFVNWMYFFISSFIICLSYILVLSFVFKKNKSDLILTAKEISILDKNHKLNLK